MQYSKLVICKYDVLFLYKDQDGHWGWTTDVIKANDFRFNHFNRTRARKWRAKVIEITYEND